MSYSAEQMKAIVLSNQNLLVSASAGSGKTTVLIERILNKLKQEQWDVTDILVVTFTEAAANEMKQRLRIKLNQEVALHPTPHLRRQLPLLATASISTFHAFCSSVIHKFFYLIDGLSSYRINDDIENFLLLDETLETLFTEWFDQNDPDFMKLIHRFTTKEDASLKKLLTSLYHSLRSVPYPEELKQRILSFYEMDDNDLSTWIHYPHLMETIHQTIKKADDAFKNALALSLEVNHPYVNLYEGDMAILDILRGSLSNFSTFIQVMPSIQIANFRSNVKDEVDKTILDTIKNFRDEGKILIEGLKKRYGSYQVPTLIRMLKRNKPLIESLFSVLDRFDLAFKAKKIAKNRLDFSDLEEQALKILSLNHFNNEATTFYRSQFKEIMIDEYQDTNGMQDTIIQAICQNNNLFMVGDVKQSIYRFRRADPDIFQQRFKTYGNQEGGTLIHLNKNYRSRKEVLDVINYLFTQLMDEELFEIAYDEQAKLHFGQTQYNQKVEPMVHLALLEEEKLANLDKDKVEKEAIYVAQTIRKLIDCHEEIMDHGAMRALTYKDIVIISRSKQDQEVYNEVFKKFHIPFLAQEMKGYFNSVEVSTMIALLRVMDNPLQNIPMLAILRSSIFQMDEKDFIELKFVSKKDAYFDKINDYLLMGRNEVLKTKCTYFIEQLNSYRDMIKNEPLSEVLFSIYHETNFYDFVLGQVGGIQRQANLDALYDKAKEYEQLTSNSLFRFLQLIQFLIENEKDLDQARTVSDQEDLVRFMTIHKSKGLEFPIVFLVNLNKRYNIADEKEIILFDKDLGLTFSYLNQEYRVNYTTIYQSLIKDHLHQKMLAEELRLLYVALTRAKEQLFLVGTVISEEKVKAKINHIQMNKDLLLHESDRSDTNYLSLILNAMARHKGLAGESLLVNEPTVDIQWISQLDDEPVNVAINQDKDLDFSRYFHEFKERLSFIYPNTDLTTHFSKQTIADIKRAQNEDEFVFSKGTTRIKVPQFMATRKDATTRGTAIHLFMQHLDFRKTYSLIELQELKLSLVVKEILTDEEAHLIDLSPILKFLSSDLAHSFKTAKSLLQELPFTTLIDSKTVYSELTTEVDLLVQGVMDLVVIWDTHILLLDFKSDQNDGSELAILKLKEAYKIQMGIYKDALKRMYPNYSITTILYVFSINRPIEM